MVKWFNTKLLYKQFNIKNINFICWSDYKFYPSIWISNENYSPTRTETKESRVFKKSCRTCSPEGVPRAPHPLSRFFRAGIKMEDRRVSTACSSPLPFFPFPLVSKRVKVTSCCRNKISKTLYFLTAAWWNSCYCMSSAITHIALETFFSKKKMFSYSWNSS